MILPALLLALLQSPADSAVAGEVKSDSLRTVNAMNVTVYADQSPRPVDARISPSTRSIDQLMELASATMTRRAALASEPSIRGLHGNQLALTIDGMKVQAACVDHMDPPTAYMELASLDRLDVQRGTEDLRYGANLGGSLTFTLQQPDFETPLGAQATLTAESNGLGRTASAAVNSAAKNLATRAAYTYRKADDFSAGGNSVITGSNFEKHNLTINAAWSLAPSQTLRADVIYDLATFIGFPALLMDTRRAAGAISSLTWTGSWKSGLHTSVKAYANTVDHEMDDYSRSIEEVQTRPFMPNMNMPMVGKSTTLGLLAEASTVAWDGILSAVIDVSWLRARADMDMLPLDTSVTPMHLINVGDASIGVMGLMVKYDVELDAGWLLTAQLRADVSPRTLLDATAQSVLLAYVPTAEFERVLFGTSANVALGYLLSEFVDTRLVLSTSQRLPTHLEQYGFYLYDPQSNFTTIGNPNLDPERSWNVESITTFRDDHAQASVSVYLQRISNFIAPDVATQIVNGTAPPERIYGNIGGAVLAGCDVSATVRLSDISLINAVVGYTNGSFVDVDDAMPMIPPLFYRLRYSIGNNTIQAEASVQGSVAQHHISTIVRPENVTASWCIGNLGVTWLPDEHLRIGMSALNILDTSYHDHLSVNDLSSPGRSFRLVLATLW